MGIYGLLQILKGSDSLVNLVAVFYSVKRDLPGNFLIRASPQKPPCSMQVIRSLA